MGIKHTKVSAITDTANTNLVRPSDWNSDHTIDGNVDFGGFDALNLGNMPTSGGGTFVDIVVDYGAVGDGVANEKQAFLDFTADYQGEDVVLYIPPGEYKFSGNVHSVFAGIANLMILGYGATLFDINHATNDNYLSLSGGLGLVFGDAPSYTALIADTTLGATSVTCLTPADAAKFTVDEWVLVAGCELQGDDWPFNPAYFEFVKVTSINAGTGVVAFSHHPLRDGPYRSDWPSYVGFTNLKELTSGPASIYRMDDGWGKIQVCGVHFLDPFVDIGNRETYFLDCEFDGAPNVSVSMKYTLDRCVISGQGRTDTSLEMDKLVQDFIVRSCYFRSGILVQSANKRMYVENSRCNISGTTRFCHIVNCNVGTINVGPRFVGTTEQLLIENSCVENITDFGSFRETSSSFGTVTANWTYTNGVISQAKDGGTLGVGGGNALGVTPGTHMVSYNHANQIWERHPFTITDVYESGGNVNAVVDLTAGAWAQLSDRIIAHPCFSMTVNNCYGSKAIEDLNAAPDESPFWSYVKRRITDPNDLSGTDHIYIRGYVKEFWIDVIRGYTGTAGTLTFREDTTESINSSSGFLEFNIDAKTAGKRRITRYGNWGMKSTDGTISSGWKFGFLKRFIGAPELSASITGEDPSTWPIIELTIWTSHTTSPDIVRAFPRYDLDDLHGSDQVHATVTSECRIDMNGIDAQGSSIALNRFSNGTTPARLVLAKSRAADTLSYTVVQSGDELGAISFEGADGVDWASGAYVVAKVDGTPGSNDMPTRLEFQVTPDGSATLATRMVIKNDGGVILGATAGSPGAGNLLLGTTTHAFANLPAAPAVGMIAYVSDSNTIVYGATVAGGGANKVLAWYNGTNWTVFGS